MDRRTPTQPRRMAAGHVLVAGFVALSLAAVLNAPALEQTANGLPYGVERTIATTAVKPLVALSSVLRLDRPRLAIDRALGRETTVRTAERADPQPLPSAAPIPAVEGEPVRLPANRPLDVWIIGDSMVELFGPHLSDQMQKTAPDAFSPEVDFRYISGLTRPDYFDWPAHMRRRMRTDPPDIVVVMFGGNDGQSVTVDGVHYEKWTRPWFRLYRQRVEEAMDALAGQQRKAYWIGLPVMKSEAFSAHARQMNSVYREAAAERPWMSYVETWDVFTDRSGRYADYLPDANGNLRLMRYADGAHFTPNGAVRLARYVLRLMAEDLDVELDTD